jgi:hypothetical protein
MLIIGGFHRCTNFEVSFCVFRAFYYLHICFSILVDLGCNFVFIIHMQSVGINTVGRTPLTENQLAAYTRNNKNRINTGSIPLEWDSKPRYTLFERAKTTVHDYRLRGHCDRLLYFFTTYTFRPELARIG